MISSKDFFLALDQLEQEKKIDRTYFISALESALTSAYKKNFGEARSATVKLNPEKGTIKVYAYKTVVDEVTDHDKEISLADAKAIKSTYKVGDQVGEEVTPKNFGRIAAQTARQVVMQRLREAERQNFSEGLSNRQESLTTGIVRSQDGDDFILELSGFENLGLLGPKDVIPGEKISIGDRIKVVVKRAFEKDGRHFVQVSRTLPSFVIRLFELEVPELNSGTIVVKALAREPGVKTKIAFEAVDRNVDVVGACVGNRGARINAIIDELHGERIDVIPYSTDIFEFIANAMSPADVLSVEINQENKSCTVTIPDGQLSLAIGKDGVNVRLAARLTGWRIDVVSESQVKQAENDKELVQVKSDIDGNFEEDLFEDIEEI